MSCTCGSDEKSKKRLQILQRKYETLRKDHKKLVGVAMELTQALEDYVKEEKKPDIYNTLSSCSRLYPGLFEASKAVAQSETPEVENEKKEENKDENNSDQKEGQTDEEPKEPPAVNSEKEYNEGFWSRPRIPRTPLL